ncbi:MAG: alpha/beta hydrolase [Myxococcota bacterium]
MSRLQYDYQTLLALLVASMLSAGCAGVKSSLQNNWCPAPDQSTQKSSPEGQPDEDELDAQCPPPQSEPQRGSKIVRTQAPTGSKSGDPRSVASEEIEFQSQGDTLTGVIERPETISEPLPAVLILHDSGPLGRDGIFHGALGLGLPVEVAVYQELSEMFARNGFVVMRYDKRTCVQGGPVWCDYPREYVEPHRKHLANTLLKDSDQALSVLRKHAAVDPDRVSVLGHGQGAELAVMLSSRRPVEALMLLAPSPYALDRLILHQTDFSLQHLRARRKSVGNTTEGDLLDKQIKALEASREKQKSTFEALRDGERVKEALGAPGETWMSFFALHREAMKSLKTLETPVLAIFGEADQDLPEDAAEQFQKLLNEDVYSEVLLLDALSHVMVSVDAAQEESTQVAEDVEQALLHFFEESERQREELQARN